MKDDTPKDFVEFLQKKITTDSKVVTSGSPVIIQSIVQHLAQISPNPQQFVSKVEDLKEKKYRLHILHWLLV